MLEGRSRGRSLLKKGEARSCKQSIQNGNEFSIVLMFRCEAGHEKEFYEVCEDNTKPAYWW